MITEIFLVAIMALLTLGEDTLSTDTYLLANILPDILLNAANNYIFDGPDYISHAPTTPTTTHLPTLKQMKYYNYYTASVYCEYELKDLSCIYCQKFKKDVNEHKILRNDTTNTLALVTVSESRQEIVAAFRGTLNIPNVILDALLINANYPGDISDVRIHKGFCIAAMSLYDQMVNELQYHRRHHPKYKIVITGHSLGGAMARVTEYFLIYYNRFPGAIYEVYTYGEPRVGNKAFADFLNKQTITTARIVNRADIVPHVGPTSILTTSILGDFYIHVQTEYWINGEYSRFCDQSVYEDPTCSDSLGPEYSLLDHVTYFDADYVTCAAKQPAELLALPFNILEPVNSLPPVPTKLSNVLGRLGNLVVNVASPTLGR